jgi:hypothetical protein
MSALEQSLQLTGVDRHFVHLHFVVFVVLERPEHRRGFPTSSSNRKERQR